MQVKELEWTGTEQQIARDAFDRAHQREIARLIESVQGQMNSMTAVEDIWRLHDFLSAKRHEIDGKYDYEHAALIFSIAGFVKDGLLQLDELSGLDSSKIKKISALARF